MCVVLCVEYKNVVETRVYINRGNWQQNEIHEQMIMIVMIVTIYCGWSTDKVVIVK